VLVVDAVARVDDELWLNVPTVAGWLLSTVFALSLTRFGKTS